MSRLAKVIVLDAGFSAWPLIKELSKRSISVMVVGNRGDDPVHFSGLENVTAVNMDYSDFDRVNEFCLREQIDMAIPGCTDLSYECANALDINKEFDWADSRTTIQAISDKVILSEVLNDLGIVQPKFSDKPLGQRCLRKPRSGFSGMGISSGDRISASEIDASKKHYFFQECIEGSLHSCSLLVSSGFPVFLAHVDEFCFNDNYRVNFSYISRLDANVKREAEEQILALAKELGISDGVLHCQFIWDGSNVYIIDVARRCPGDLYGLLVHRGYGVGYYDKLIGTYLGEIQEVVARPYEVDPYQWRATMTEEDRYLPVRIPNAENIRDLSIFSLGSAFGLRHKGAKDRASILFGKLCEDANPEEFGYELTHSNKCEKFSGSSGCDIKRERKLW